MPEGLIEFKLHGIESLRAKSFGRAANDPASAIASVDSACRIRRERDGVFRSKCLFEYVVE